MTDQNPMEIFLVTAPGLEQSLAAEAADIGFANPIVSPGGVTIQGHWPDVWKANLMLRGATRVLVRIGAFPVFHLAQLDKRARKFPWATILGPGHSVRVETTCKTSKIYHDRAATQRIEKAIADTTGAEISATGDITVKARIENNFCTFSVDSSGESLHKRGHKTATGKAPIRETLAALFLREMGFDGSQTVVDPMCGSGTFLLEAAEWAAGIFPGRSRSFAFENLASFDPDKWTQLKATQPIKQPTPRFVGSDRNDGAIANSKKNAETAGISELVTFHQASISDLQRPETAPGIVIVNPPYGGRIGNKKLLFSLYGSLGKTLLQRFSGWKVGVITNDAGLAKATELPFLPTGAVVPNGGIKIKLYQTAPLP